jgi:methionyl-tRNA synthetase
MGGCKLREERILLQRIDIAEIRAKLEDRTAASRDAGGAERIRFEDFRRLDLRVGVVREVLPVEGAERLWRLSVDLGGETRTCVAGLRGAYTAEELVGRSVVLLVNLEPRTIRGIRSEAMLLATEGERAAIVGPDRPVDPGCAVG